MTSEVVVLNKSGVSIAADSAVTISVNDGNVNINKKVYNTANKVFMLSKSQPVGVMVYNSMTLCGIPWETVIKEYRKYLDEKAFDTVEEYAQNFIDYICNQRTLFNEKQQKLVLLRMVVKIFNNLLAVRSNNPLNSNQKVRSTLDEKIKLLKEKEFGIGLDEKFTDEIQEKFKRELDLVSRDIFKRQKVSTRGIIKKLRQYASLMLAKSHLLSAYTGIVFIGFGEKEYFPSVHSFYIDGIVNDKLIIYRNKSTTISENTPSAILPFAQTEMMEGVIKGAPTSTSLYLIDLPTQIIKNLPKIIINYIDELSTQQKSKYIKAFEKPTEMALDDVIKSIVDFEQNNEAPIMRAISLMPISELAVISELFVNIEQFRHRLSLEAETVGGPIDVAVISKGDGFVWIKRKHYFNKEYNPRFFNHYISKL